MSGNSGSQGRASGFDNIDGRRYSRESFREGPKPADARPAMRSSELYELERLIRKYPAESRRFLDGSGTTTPP
jgi:hypothetical protein